MIIQLLLSGGSIQSEDIRPGLSLFALVSPFCLEALCECLNRLPLTTRSQYYTFGGEELVRLLGLKSTKSQVPPFAK